MDRRGGDRRGARGRPRGDRHYSGTRGRQGRRMRKCGPTGICEWLREHRRRSCALRSAAGLLRSHAVRPTAAPERQRVCQLQRPVGQRQRVQLGRLLIASRIRQADDVLLLLAATSSCTSPAIRLLRDLSLCSRLGRSHYPLVAGSSPARPTSEPIFPTAAASAGCPVAKQNGCPPLVA
jgi:hypothetical protein